MSEVNLDPIVSLVRELLSGVADGTVSPDEAAGIFRALADVLEEIASMLPKWWHKAVMATAATALRQGADGMKDLDTWPRKGGTDGE
jgi:hypothetical protein